jgi:hypothetical protein
VTLGGALWELYVSQINGVSPMTNGVNGSAWAVLATQVFSFYPWTIP